MNFGEFAKGQLIFDNGYKKRKPVVSIVTPTYCRMKEGLLKRCIESVQAQTYTDYEHIIIDDGSSDGSQDLILEYAKEDDRIVYVRHDQNSGLPAIRTNEGILLARGEYIAFAFDDNVLKPEFLETLLDGIKESGADIEHSVAELPTNAKDSILFGTQQVSKEKMLLCNQIANGSVLCRKDVFEKIGLYDPHLCVKRVCDWDLWIRALEFGLKLHGIDKVLHIEYGVASENSLGNTVYLDFKISAAYITDATRRAERNEKLKPRNIDSYTIFDIHAVLPYVRDYYEMQQLESNVYLPYFKKHNDIYNDSPIHDRLFIMKPTAECYPLLEAASVSKRPRIVLVTKNNNQYVRKWIERCTNQMPGAITLVLREDQLPAIRPVDTNLLLLLDCMTNSTLQQTNEFIANKVPVGYIACEKAWNAEPSVSCEATAKATESSALLQLRYQIMVNSDFIVTENGVTISEEFPNLSFTDYSDISHLNFYDWAILKHAVRGKTCAVFVNSPLFAGSETYGVMLAQILSSYALKVCLCIPAEDAYKKYSSMGALKEYASDKGVKHVLEISFIPGPYYNGPYNYELETFLRENQVGLVVGSSLIADVAVTAAHLHIPTLFSIFSPANYRPQELGILRQNSSAVISDCQRTCDIYNTAFGLDCKKLIDVLDPSAFRPFKDSKEKRVRVATAGTLVPRKQQLEMVRACHFLIEQGYDIEFNLYGISDIFADYRDRILEYIKKNALQDRIVVHGFVEDDREITENNDIIFTASVEEGLPQGILFNMAGGLVAVATPVGGIDEVVIDGETGYLAEGFGVENAAAALKHALDDRANWKTIVGNAQTLLEEQCNIQTVSTELLSYLAPKVSVANAVFSINKQVSQTLAAPQNVCVTPSTGVIRQEGYRSMRRINADMLCASHPLKKARNYQITITQHCVTAVMLIFSSRGIPANSMVTIELYTGNELLRAKTVGADALGPDTWSYFHFDPLVGYEMQTLTLRIIPHGCRPAVYEYRKNRSFWYKVLNKMHLPVRGKNTVFFEVLDGNL